METDNQDTESTETETDETPDAPETETETQGSDEVTPVDKPSKKERRAERAAEHNARQEAAQLREQLREARERHSTLEASVAEMRGYLQAKHQKENEGQDDDKKKIAALRREANNHLKLAGAARTEEGVNAEMEAFYEKMEAANVIAAQRVLRPQIEQGQRSQPTMEQLNQRQQLATEFPWALTNRRATALAGAIEADMIAEGKPATVATSRAALAEAAKMLNLGGHQPPTNQQRSAYSGIPSREGENGNGAQKQVLNPAALQDWQKKLAEKAYPELEAPQAHKAWSNLMNKHFQSQNGTR